MGKTPIIHFAYMGKIFIIEFFHNFLYVWNCMKLYEKKFPIYENCMISSFGQPGKLIAIHCYAITGG